MSKDKADRENTTRMREGKNSKEMVRTLEERGKETRRFMKIILEEI